MKEKYSKRRKNIYKISILKIIKNIKHEEIRNSGNAS